MRALVSARLTAVVLPLLLSGCAAVSALSGGGSTSAYELRPPPDLPAATRQQPVDFIVEVPSASGAIDTDLILVRPNAVEVSYLPDAQWTDDVPLMLQSALVEALERTGGFRYVGRRPIGPGGDYALISNITDFSAYVTGEDAIEVEIMLTARLIREDDAAVVASERFLASGAAGSTSNVAIAAAYNAAGQDLIRDMSAWILAERGILAR